MRKAILQAWLLVGGLILTLTLNGLANALPLFGRMTGEISDSLPNLFVPSGLTFSIWGVIYLGLLAFSLYQLGRAYKTPDALPAWLSAIAPWVIISHIANAAWIIAWHALQYTISVVLMIILFIALMKTMTKLKWSKNALSGKEFWLVCVPFSLYSGWITVALPANITG
ncbi:MAG: tryptophan-rich sensory protein, partial [Spirochaetaceae bacterium]